MDGLCNGETMRAYAGFQIPGMDLLCDRREFTTAKQVQSVVRQYGREAMISELYGVTNWSFDFRGHKLQGDWQAALGVTVRAPHLAWTSMEGEAKRDYPASIFYQSPWYKEYRLLEDHFARVNMALMSGKPVVKIGVIHPMESYWLHYGPQELNGRICQEMEERFEGITRCEADGCNGPVSADNIRWLQRAAGLPQTGCMDTATWDALSHLYEIFVVQDTDCIPAFTGGWG